MDIKDIILNIPVEEWKYKRYFGDDYCYIYIDEVIKVNKVISCSISYPQHKSRNSARVYVNRIEVTDLEHIKIIKDKIAEVLEYKNKKEWEKMSEKVISDYKNYKESEIRYKFPFYG